MSLLQLFYRQLGNVTGRSSALPYTMVISRTCPKNTRSEKPSPSFQNAQGSHLSDLSYSSPILHTVLCTPRGLSFGSRHHPYMSTQVGR